jgi:arsenical pump membrane protein
LGGVDRAHDRVRRGRVSARRLAAGEQTYDDELPSFRPGFGSVGVIAAAALVLFLSHPALPVLALGAAIIALSARLGAVRSLRAANPALLLGVLGIAVLLGTIARAIDVNLLEHAGRWETAWIAAGASVLVNNLPAAVVLSVHLPAHPRALLLGLDLGPNLAVTGSLSAVLWLQVARANGARASVVRYTLLGLVLVPVTLAAALLVSSV